MDEYQEGYVDGLAGIGMQDRWEATFKPGVGQTDDHDNYDWGFIAGSRDRKEMLNREQR